MQCPNTCLDAFHPQHVTAFVLIYSCCRNRPILAPPSALELRQDFLREACLSIMSHIKGGAAERGMALSCKASCIRYDIARLVDLPLLVAYFQYSNPLGQTTYGLDNACKRSISQAQPRR
jgi:hypothetical protein